MGQYYMPVNVDMMEHVYTHDYCNGLKLMEHSYVGNNFMNIIEELLAPGGPWHRWRLVWAGDYMDEGIFLTPEQEREYALKGDDPERASLYLYAQKCGIKIVPPNQDKHDRYNRYLANHTKKMYVDLRECPRDEANWGMKIHPLPLLTSSGNGRGGGDYHYPEGDFMDPNGKPVVGSWAGDIISVERSTKQIAGYAKLTPNFTEYWRE